MKCERCGKNRAEVVLKVSLEGEVLRQQHLCRACLTQDERPRARRLRPHGEGNASRELICPTCRLRFSEFCASGYLGCAQCYATFDEHLTDLLKVHCGEGYFARDFTAVAVQPQATALHTQLLELERALQEAVREERYEVAATIRDEIEMLKTALSGQ